MRTSVPASLTRLALALLLPGAASCVNISPPGTALTSEPPGARVEVDGHDSGWVTPCLIALDEDETHLVRIVLDGHAPHEIVLEPFYRRSAVSLSEGVTGMRSTLQFPTRLPVQDLLFPLRESYTMSPARVFVRLRPESAP